MSTSTAFTPSGMIVLTAAGLAQDEGARRLGRAFYDAAVRDAIIELCYDTNWDHRAADKIIPENRIIKLPHGMVSLRNIFAYNGNECNVDSSVQVHLKENYTHDGGKGFFANQKGVNDDPMVGNTFLFREPGNLFYCGIDMNKLYLSPQVKERFEKVRIMYVGLGACDECTVPAVPTWAKDAVTYWVARRACQMRQKEGNLFVKLERDYAAQIENPQLAWTTAKLRYKRMDYKARHDANIYNTQFGNGPI